MNTTLEREEKGDERRMEDCIKYKPIALLLKSLKIKQKRDDRKIVSFVTSWTITTNNGSFPRTFYLHHEYINYLTTIQKCYF